MKRITKTRALEIYSTIYPKDDVRAVPDDYFDRARRGDIAWEIEEVCLAPSLDKAFERVAWWIGGDKKEVVQFRKEVIRMRAMGRAKRK